MIYLCEQEMGFDTAAIGFPSIDNCRAIVLVTAGGLIGFHLMGTLARKKANFVSFVNTLGHAGAKRTLYIVSKLTTHNATDFAAEATEIAAAINFTGPVYSADVSSAGLRGVYVVFDNVGNNTCVVSARNWDDPVDAVPGNQVPYVAVNRGTAIGSANATMYSTVSAVGLKAVYPTKLA